MDDKTEIDEMKWALERQLGWIQSADTKLTILVPVPTAMLGVLWTYVERIPDMTWTVLVPYLVATGLLAAALFLAAMSVVPNRWPGLFLRLLWEDHSDGGPRVSSNRIFAQRGRLHQ